MLKTGRNDACPCGSGKKFKKCCLGKSIDMPYRSELSLAVPQHRYTPQDYDVSLAEFESAVARQDVDKTFKAMEVLYRSANDDAHKLALESVFARFEAEYPTMYAEYLSSYCLWRLVNALSAERPESIKPILVRADELAQDDIDAFEEMLDHLEFHGYLEASCEARRTAWPGIKASSTISSPGRLEFHDRWLALQIGRALEAGPPDVVPDVLAQYIQHSEDTDRVRDTAVRRSGQSSRRWMWADFACPVGFPSDYVLEDVAHLCEEFEGYLRRTEGVPRSKALLAAWRMQQYLEHRGQGELDPREHLLGGLLYRKTGRPNNGLPERWICPDRDTLDRHLADLVSDLTGRQPVKAAVLFESVPAWLRFLVDRGLLDDAERQACWDEIEPLRADLITALGWYDTARELCQRLRAGSPGPARALVTA
jgi:hypothetical protein